MKTLWFVLLLAINGFAIYGSFDLSMKDWTVGDVCPKILSIPACYIVFSFFVLAFVSHFLKHANAKWIFFFAVGMVTLIATTGTVGELTGLAKCPRTSDGTPMCFISLGICISLLLSKVMLLRAS